MAGRREACIAVGIGLGYLALWPVPIEPTEWTAPANPGTTGAFAANRVLEGVRVLAETVHGCEDVDVDHEGRVYGSSSDGNIWRVQSDGRNPEVFVTTGGRPLGLDFDASGGLWVADARVGLLHVSEAGELRTVLTEVDGQPLLFTDDVDVAPDGVVYFTDASARWPIDAYVLDLVEHQATGRLLAWNPMTGQAATILDGLHFANGVAVAPDGQSVVVVETSMYRLMRVWIEGPRSGEVEVFVSELPGFPDGVSVDEAGRFWVAVASPRKWIVDQLSGWPSLRRVMTRLPTALWPKPTHYGMIVMVDEDGNIIGTLQDPTPEAYAPITSVEPHGDGLYLGSLGAGGIGYLPKPVL